MNTYLEVTFPSWGVGRVAFQLEKYLPPALKQVSDPGVCDLQVIHVVGRHDHMVHTAEKLLADGKQYAVIQYALESTRNPKPEHWHDLWDRAKVVWSYYDLSKYTAHNFYHAPLAADPHYFYPVDLKKRYGIGANGDDYPRECVGEVRLAAWRARQRVAHVGREVEADPNVTYFKDITDDELRDVYASCRYWSALRRVDGFELPAVEALMCGVRPIMFDTPNYRQWFDGLALFVPEVESAKLVPQIENVLRHHPQPIDDITMEAIRFTFNWEHIIKGFWERCLA